MKIAVLYLLTGVGHFRESLAIKEALEEADYEVDLFCPFDYLRNSSSFLGKVLLRIYQIQISLAFFVMANFSFIWGRGLSEKKTLFSELTIFISSLCRGFDRLTGRLIGPLMKLKDYDYVISTHPFASEMMVGYFKTSGKDLSRLINVCPDEVGRAAASFYLVKDLFTCVNSESTKKMFLSLGLPAERIRVTGHPLDPQIAQNRQKIFERVQKELKSGQLKIGLYIGGFGPRSQKNGIISVLKELASAIKDRQVSVKVLTGLHRDFSRQLDLVLREWGLEGLVEVYRPKDYQSLIKEGHQWLLEGIDVMFSRPSELVFYSLATGIPHIVFPPAGPQERDMLGLLRTYAPVAEYAQIKGQLKDYLFDFPKLTKIGQELYNSHYNILGAQNISLLLK